MSQASKETSEQVSEPLSFSCPFYSLRTQEAIQGSLSRFRAQSCPFSSLRPALPPPPRFASAASVAHSRPAKPPGRADAPPRAPRAGARA